MSVGYLLDSLLPPAPAALRPPRLTSPPSDVSPRSRCALSPQPPPPARPKPNWRGRSQRKKGREWRGGGGAGSDYNRTSKRQASPSQRGLGLPPQISTNPQREKEREGEGEEGGGIPRARRLNAEAVRPEVKAALRPRPLLFHRRLNPRTAETTAIRHKGLKSRRTEDNNRKRQTPQAVKTAGGI
ncbi:hypothetical protein chiPu_0002739 [Chiloscyllium punctatum]|uniref:Uncharacterized protein n=1 Tax=Chiloscyllium punctatum TaxID=137246 RepID=A0A401S1S1_CHIPU|nr:hypothetical protein [Chiloscyllium punctatum]